MTADPNPTPVTCGCVEVVAPSLIKIAEGDTVTFDVSLLVSDIKTPPAGAGAGSVMVNCDTCCRASATLDGTARAGCEGWAVTLTLPPALANPVADAVIFAVPAAIPETGTVALDAPCANVTEGGTVAAAGLLDVRVAVIPDAAGEESIKTRVPDVPGVSDRLAGEKLIVGLPGVPPLPTITSPVAGERPDAMPVMVALPTATPVTLALA
jgi:hypothetical protein